MIDRIKRLISTNLSRRHVPAKILECPGNFPPLNRGERRLADSQFLDIPYTATAKRVEVAVKKLVNGADVRSLNTKSVSTAYLSRPNLT